MTDKQELFANYYIELLNATESYKKAYPNASQRTAESNGNKLLNNTEVRKYIDERLGKRKADAIASADEVLELLTQVARGELTEDIVTGKGNVVYDMKPQINSRLKALDLLAKRYGLLTEKLDVNATVGVTIVDDMEQED